MERLMLNMENKEHEKTILKKWTKVNGNGNDGNGDASFHPSTIVYKTIKASERLSFSIGDTWTEIIDGIVCFYKVQLIEDIIIPAGKYRCFKVSEEMDGGIRNHYWFASNVGIVKWEVGEIKGVLQNCSM
ncbi:MAG: hypothetical protein A2Z50_06435 [Nitrospirae bacterium RBG_19FT_COMBO_42_15]|nr:MAG: hypothetical protein A2Z50_06435 [Nitrospirae bacterium RBG_19FT_COMBO_42_15]